MWKFIKNLFTKDATPTNDDWMAAVIQNQVIKSTVEKTKNKNTKNTR